MTPAASVDPYLTLFLIGAGGLAAMAFIGGGHHAHGGSHVHAGHAHAGAGHARGAPHAHTTQARGGARASRLFVLLEPRLLFSLALGAGATGLLTRHWLGGALLAGVAIAGAVVFESLFVRPLWTFAFRFAGRPAAMLESALYERATVATAFDADGYGLVTVPLDGQVRQVLARLPEAERSGPRLHAGDTVRVTDVDLAAQRVTVSRDIG